MSMLLMIPMQLEDFAIIPLWFWWTWGQEFVWVQNDD